MGPAKNVGARFRQRKISVKQTLQILRQKDIPDFDIEEQQRELQHIETGVEKGEEEEHHLQQVINASAAKFKGASVEQVYIPTPDASKVWKDAKKFYYHKFNEPQSYIKFSATVEDTSGCPYNMDEIDEIFLNELNKNFKIDSDKCTEDEFEIISNVFDKIVDDRQPFLSMDPQQILKYDEIKSIALSPDFENSDLHKSLANKLNINTFKTFYDLDFIDSKEPRKLDKLLELFGVEIYEHWKNRRIERNGKPVFPTLRFEDPSQKDDSNPYTCFRRREFRQARKTRRTDVQSIEKLKCLYTDLKRAENLLLSIASRENKRLEFLDVKFDTFKLRNELKNISRDENVKVIEDDLLVDKSKKKRLPLGYIPPPPQIKIEKDQSRSKSKDNSNQINRNNNNNNNKKQVKNDTSVNKKTANNRLSSNNQINQNGNLNNFNQNNNINNQNRIPQTTIQPYVKLPTSKIPDIDLTTVNTVLKDKLEGIKKAVSDKLIKRRLQDEGWINFTDDPYNPYFDMSPTGENEIEERNHIPYSSIISSMFEVENSREINFSHIFNNNRHYSNSDSEIVKINLFTGQVVKNDRHSSLPEFYDLVGDNSTNSEFGTSREVIEDQFNEKNRLNVSEVLLKVRKRPGRGGRIWMDRKRIHDDTLFEEYLNLPEEEEEEKEEGKEEEEEKKDKFEVINIKGSDDSKMDIDEPLFDAGEKIEIDDDKEKKEENSINLKKRKNAYDCRNDFKKRLKSKFMFDSDLPKVNPLDPSKLNQIGKQTQAIRFGCMLLTKAYDNMHQIRQKQILQQQQKLQQQQQQREKFLREQKEREKQQLEMLRQQAQAQSQPQPHQKFQQDQQQEQEKGDLNSTNKSIPSASNTDTDIINNNNDKKNGISKSDNKFKANNKEKKVKKEPDSKKLKTKKGTTSGTPKNSNKNNLSDLANSPSIKVKVESGGKIEKENKVS
jgi:enhancer of polycomb-like protein